jgi:tRNA (guanine37-N1)-methyltransferase
MRIDLLTLFPQMCQVVMDESIIGRACEKGIIQVNCHNIRDYTNDKQRRVDDYPYGGGMGMIIQAEPIANCFEYISSEIGEKPYFIYMSPKGKRFCQQDAIRLSSYKNISVLCGHYEGVDQRAIDTLVDEEISIGDYVLTGGELPALIICDSILRLVPGVLSDEECFTDESFYNGLLEYPHYTRPAKWNDIDVPDVLLSGHHANIISWRRKKALEITLNNRPDLLKNANLSKEDIKYMEIIKNKNE